jgi:hypothetical protein
MCYGYDIGYVCIICPCVLFTIKLRLQNMFSVVAINREQERRQWEEEEHARLQQEEQERERREQHKASIKDLSAQTRVGGQE